MPAHILFDQFARQEISDWTAAQPGTESDRCRLTSAIIRTVIEEIQSAPGYKPGRAEPVPGMVPPRYRVQVYQDVWLWYTVQLASRWNPWRREDRIIVTRFG